jgi:hypothetical protein
MLDNQEHDGLKKTGFNGDITRTTALAQYCKST